MSAIRTTSRLISAYAQIEPEEWKLDHDLAMVSRDFEEVFTWGVQLFRGLTKIEAAVQAEVCQTDCSLSETGSEAIYASLAENYRRLLVVFEKTLIAIRRLGLLDCTLDGVEEFYEVVEEARCIVDSMELESEIRPIEELIPLARPENPRPERYGD